MKGLTVGQLIKELEKYNKKMLVIVTEEGPGHDYPILKKDIGIVQNPYFGNSEPITNEPVTYDYDTEEEIFVNVLRIASI